MSIGVVARKTLWGRAGNACAFETCRQPLIVATDEATGEVLAHEGVLVGEEAHIRSGRSDGPRYEETFDAARVDTYGNLILLCPTHHTLIDKDPNTWPTERVEALKDQHEAWVRSRLSVAEQRNVDMDMRVAAEVQRLEEALFDRWQNVYWQLSQPIPHLADAHFEALVEAGAFLLAKDWPIDYPLLASAAERVRLLIGLVITHINNCFDHSSEGGYRLYRPEKHLRRWDPPVFAEMFQQTQLNMVASWWLVDHLTMSLNNWISAVRSDLDPAYRFSEGVVLAVGGDGIIDAITFMRLEYETGSALPEIPQSVNHLQRAVGIAAEKQGVEPQSVWLSNVDLAAVAGEG